MMKSLTKAQRRTLTERQAKIDACTSAVNILEVFNNHDGILLYYDEYFKYDEHYKAGYQKAIELAKDMSEILQVLRRENITDTPEELMAFEKLLSLAKDKGDIGNIFKKFLIPLLKRAYVLPDHKEDAPE